jgi:5-methylcytosine-specific restriction endonuclease McrA
MKRTLNSKTARNALWIYAQGLCAICKSPLDQWWEADHIKPYRLTKDTNIHSMQATCRPCNRKKGGRYDA